MITRQQTWSLKLQEIRDLTHQESLSAEPHSYAKALAQPHWERTMNEEFLALLSQNTWTLAPSPPRANIQRCKWMFKTKYNFGGSVAYNKARLVAQSFKQLESIHYNETFSSVAKFTIVRIFITIVVYQNWNIQQLELSNSFLFKELTEQVYMHQSPSFINNSCVRMFVNSTRPFTA